ncbi:hypothetical protein AOL_s00215g762 [Orbilia oligospora ATCC 24927]|uniref:Apple domain-containing protein n=1 Tax=Arthrobotrys oligospora (strain ATCC 24927 / CBS 115.81 / DSM 1491) TaxID=756982 RepID=G1XUV4_ARTOA|nr:hypothetical protein AOL_s00215g762 [Orbilia oligospora ATCC 24927]EGX43153.1 hypothetical protein AOL_s00215g762 [Orbilia oligospora ATCC 24927]
MKFSLAALSAAAACFVPLASAKPITHSWDLISKRGSNTNVCKDVQLVVSILKLNKATPFCSTFLGIKTQTVPTTKVSTVLTTTTLTESAYATITETAKTEVLTFTNTVTDATVPTTVATEIIPSTTVLTVTVTPNPSIIYTTTYTTPAGVARRSIAVEERGVNFVLPPFVTQYASSAISKACNCLSLTTPTTTSTVQVVQTSTVISTVTKTHTNTIPVTLTLSTTEIAKATAFDPKTITSTSTTTSYFTTTLPRVTTTQTVSLPFKTPYCVNILKEKKLVYYGNLVVARTYAGLGNPSVPRGEEGLSMCCQICYNTPDCSLWNYFDSANGAFCELVGGYTALETGVSTTCPKGISPASTVSGTGTDRVNTDAGYYSSGIGPCYKGDF